MKKILSLGAAFLGLMAMFQDLRAIETEIRMPDPVDYTVCGLKPVERKSSLFPTFDKSLRISYWLDYPTVGESYSYIDLNYKISPKGVKFFTLDFYPAVDLSHSPAHVYEFPLVSSLSQITEYFKNKYFSNSLTLYPVSDTNHMYMNKTIVFPYSAFQQKEFFNDLYKFLNFPPVTIAKIEGARKIWESMVIEKVEKPFK